MRAPSYTSLDDTLEAIAGYGVALTNGNSNHAPMVAEALCALGRPEAVTPWIARYRERMIPRPPTVERILPEEWRGALGKRDRFTDWAAFFRDELREAPWPPLLDRWVSRLTPGFCAAATHGVIRVGHAVRSLSAAETMYRMRELADALASWAATYQELPTPLAVANGTMSPCEAIAKVPVIPLAHRRNLGNITASLAMLDDFPEFEPVIGLIDIGVDTGLLLAELTEVFARAYLANAHNIQTTIVFIHGVTSLAALGSIIPLVSDATARSALRYGWQSACGLYACFGGESAVSSDIDLRDWDEDRLIDSAITNGDEHVIKFTEGCLRRNTISPSPAYFAAVDRALAIMPRR
jgi:Questin oxidase-like